MGTSRMEAFSDGVLAVAITIMVLALRPPDGNTFTDLWNAAGAGFLINALSFAYVGIYWNNHHHIFQLVDRVNGAVLWANLHLLFWLVLIPFSTEWMERSRLAVAPTMTYAANLLLAAIAYWILETTIRRIPGEGQILANAVGVDKKAIASIILYALAIVVAPLSTAVSIALLVATAVLWLVPDRRIERYIESNPGSADFGERA